MDILMKIFLAWGLASMIIVPYIDSDRRRLEKALRDARTELNEYRSREAARLIDEYKKSYNWESGL